MPSVRSNRARSTMSRYWVITGAMLVLLPGCALSDNRTQAAPAHLGSSALALTNATVVDVHSGQLRRQQTVIISGNRITAVGDTVEIGIPPRARVIDAGGRYLI